METFAFAFSLVALLVSGIGFYVAFEARLTAARPIVPDLQISSEIKSLRIEWEDTYEKLRKLIGRIDKNRALEAPRGPIVEASGAGGPVNRQQLLTDVRRLRAIANPGRVGG